MTKINLSKTLTGFAAAAVVATVTFAASGNAFAHGMGHMNSGLHTTNLSTTTTNTLSKTSDHSRDRDRRHRRFFSVGYVTPDLVCVYKRTIHGLVKICPDDWYY